MNKKKIRMNRVLNAVTNWWGLLLGAFYAFFAPIWPLLVAILVVTAYNVWLGISAAKAKKEPFEWKKFWQFLFTLGDYFGLVIVGHVMDLWVTPRVAFLAGLEPLSTMFALGCLGAELTRVARNLRTLRGVKLAGLEKVLDALDAGPEDKKEPGEEGKEASNEEQ